MRNFVAKLIVLLGGVALVLGIAACGKDDKKEGKGGKGGGALGPVCQKYDQQLTEACKDAKGVRLEGCGNLREGWERTKRSINDKNSEGFDEMCQGFLDTELKSLLELANE